MGYFRMTIHGSRYTLLLLCAGVAELADAQDLKSWGWQQPCGFDSHPRH